MFNRLRIIVVSIVSVATVGILWSTLSLSNDEVSYKTYLTSETHNNQPTNTPATEFACSDRIYLVVEAIGLSREKRNLTVKWTNPQKKQQELTNYDFDSYSFVRLWSWLQLSGPTGSVIGQAFDPSFGMEEFIGVWHAEAFIDKKKIGNLEFSVLC